MSAKRRPEGEEEEAKASSRALSRRGAVFLWGAGAFLAVAVLVSFALWGDVFASWFTGDAAIRWIRERGEWGGAAVIGLLVADLVLPLPGTAVMSAAGFVYGFVPGALLSAAGSFVSGMSGYLLCRGLGARFAEKIAGGEELTRGKSLLERKGVWIIAVSRCLPMLPEVLCCLAGLTRMRLGAFALALACGALPAGAIYAGIGAAGQEQPGWAIGLSILVPAILWVAGRVVLGRRGAGRSPV